MPSNLPSPLASLSCASSALSLIPFILALSSPTLAGAAPSIYERAANNNPLNIDWDPAPAPEDGPPASANALRDKSYLPAQIGGIVGAYAFSLVLVAITLLCLAKKRREHLRAANDEIDFLDYIQDSKDTSEERFDPALVADAFSSYDHITRLQIPGNPGVDLAPATYVPNFSYPSPTRTEFNESAPHIHPSPISATSAPGVNFQVDQTVVAADRAMAQQQLEEMYKYAFEHEEAKQKGTVLETPIPVAAAERCSTSDRSTRSALSKKERSKPANLNLAKANEEKSQSRTSSFFSALRSPKNKTPKGVSISSPIMTPQSGTFPRQELQEMGGIPPRHYAPPPPPPVPAMPFASSSRNPGAPLTPDTSPQSVQSIDERIAVQLDTAQAIRHNRNISQAPTEYDPESATSMHSSAPLVGLPASPRSPSFHKPFLPASPKPGATFSRPNPPSAVRTGGALPLRAYEPSLASPSAQTTKQTVFERKGPLSPTTGRTPFTAGAVPYSPYQPNTPIVPMTPSLVTKEDRKRMKRLVPKTPTLQMVESSDDVW